MKKILSISSILLAFAILFSSCEEERKLYEGTQQVRILASNAHITPPPTTANLIHHKAQTFIINAATNPAPIDTYAFLRVEAVGLVPATDITVTLTVHSTSTAVAGTHYVALPATVTIPAGQTYVAVPVQGLAAGFPAPGAGNAVTLVIDATSAQATVVPTWSRFTLTLRT